MQDPIQRFQEWYGEAKKAKEVDVDAIALATASLDGVPSCRVVYYRCLVGTSFCFFTNYSSHKGHDLEQNARASAVFLWHMIGLQVRVEGPVTRLIPTDSDAYFEQRALESQLSAATSKQSQNLTSYQRFLDEIEAKRSSEAKDIHENGKIKRPDNWGGYGIEAQKIEFWQSKEHRRHLREVYVRDGAQWKSELLYP